MNWQTHFGSDSSIAAVQQKLNSFGANPVLVVDGEMGAKTIAAITQFQKDHNLTVDGKLGPETLAALGLSSGAIATELADKSTPMQSADVAKAINAGFIKVVGRVPTPDELNLLVSQTAFETNNFGRGIHNYNFGNKKFSSGDPHYQYFTCTEVIDGKTVTFNPPSVQCKFAAYANPTQSGEAFVSLIKNRSVWWNGLLTGDVTKYIAALKSGGYFSGDLTDYTKGVQKFFNEFEELAEQYAVPVGIGLGAITAIGGIALGAWYLWSKHHGV